MVALKFFYRKLELKAGNTETEFKKGFTELVRAILSHIKVNVGFIHQTWTRNMISSDTENAQIAQISVGILPTELILRNHPWVDDVEQAMKMLEAEHGEADPYDNTMRAEDEV